MFDDFECFLRERGVTFPFQFNSKKVVDLSEKRLKLSLFLIKLLGKLHQFEREGWVVLFRENFHCLSVQSFELIVFDVTGSASKAMTFGKYSRARA